MRGSKLLNHCCVWQDEFALGLAEICWCEEDCQCIAAGCVPVESFSCLICTVLISKLLQHTCVVPIVEQPWIVVSETSVEHSLQCSIF